MIETFAKFGKLPKPHPQKVELLVFGDDLRVRYLDIFHQQITMTVNVLAAPNITGYFDPKLMRDLLFNLIKNAVEANGQKTITITITLTANKSDISFIVNNSGITIPVDIAPQIFDPYISNKQATGSKLNMGLGLTIAQKIAGDHQGALWLETNDPQQGVTFICRLPGQPIPLKEKI